MVSFLKGYDITAISRGKKHLDVAKRLGAQNVITFENESQFFDVLDNDLFDAAIVFAPSSKITDIAIKSVHKGGLIVLATVGSIPFFPTFEEKTIKGTLIGSRRDMQDVIDICLQHKLEVIHETYPLHQANKVLEKLKNSQIDARAVLIP